MTPFVRFNVCAYHIQPQQVDLDKLDVNRFDVTKGWPMDQPRLQEFGWLVLNKHLGNFYRNMK